MPKEVEDILTDDAIRYIWSRLRLLSSQEAALKFLNRKATTGNLENGLLESKALGIAFNIRSAEEYFDCVPEENPTTSALRYYYGTFSLMAAILLAGSNNQDMDSLEDATKKGHGLGNASGHASDFPFSEFVYIKEAGFLKVYLREGKGINTSGAEITGKNADKEASQIKEGDATVEKMKYSGLSGENCSRLVSLWSLLARIPELLPYYRAVFNDPPLYFEYRIVSGGAERSLFSLRIRKSWEGITPDYVLDAMPEIKGHGKILDEASQNYSREHIQIYYELPNDRLPEFYESDFAPPVFIVRLLSLTNDPLVLHLVLLYLVGILVRYRPRLWRETLEGEHSEIGALLIHYLVTVQRVVPNLALDRLYDGKRFIFRPQTTSFAVDLEV